MTNVDDKIIEDTKRGLELLYALSARVAALPVETWLDSAKSEGGTWDERTRTVVRILAAAADLKRAVLEAQPLVIKEVLDGAKGKSR